MLLTHDEVLSRRFSRAELESMTPLAHHRDYDVLYRDNECELIFDRDRSVAAIMLARSDRTRPGHRVLEPLLHYVVR